MTRRMTTDEAVAFLDTAFSASPETQTIGLVDATIAGVSATTARELTDGYLAIVPADIDPATVQIHSDTIEGSDLPASHIIIQTGDGA